MGAFQSFVLALSGTFGLSVFVAGGLWRALYDLLLDVCGTTNRATFWRNYTIIVIILVPLVCVMIGRADDRTIDGWFTFVDQFRWGILGLILSLCAVALILVTSLPPTRPTKLLNNIRSEDLRRLLQKVDSVEWQPGDMDRLLHVLDEIRAQHVMKHTEKS